MQMGLVSLLMAYIVAMAVFVTAGDEDRKSTRPHGKKIGALHEKFTIDAIVALPLKNEDDLRQLLSEVYDPQSPNYEQFLTPDEFKANYCPTDDEIANISAILREKKLNVLGTSDNNLLVHVRGKAAHINKAFKVSLATYLEEDGTIYHAPSEDDVLDVPSFAHGVFGLSNRTVYRHSASEAVKSARDLSTGPAGAYSPSDIRTAYSLSSDNTAAGQTVALAQFDTFAASDITTYQNHFHLPSVTITKVLLPKTCSKCCTRAIRRGVCTGRIYSCRCRSAPTRPGSGAIEVVLDIEMVLSLAQELDELLVYIAPNSDAGSLSMYTKMATDNKASVISTSWGIAETYLYQSFVNAHNAVFLQMSIQGQSMFAASGDSGAWDDTRTLSVDDPASQPYVTGVGGTTLRTNADGTYKSETTWYSAARKWGGGGGISRFWQIPSYQNGMISKASLGSTQRRNVPDVSLMADPANGYSVYGQGQWQAIGGTSAAAPSWAAFTAITNANRQANGKSRIGSLNPRLYPLAKTADYDTAFHDIKDGSTNGHFPAVTGYDLATGLGSFQGDALLQILAAEY